MKKKQLKKIIATLMLCLTVIAALPTTKADAMNKDVYRSKFWEYLNKNNFAPSSDGATNMLYAARSTVGMTGKQLGSKGDWCCSQISCLAIVTKQEKAIPYSTNVRGMYDGIMKAGGTLVYSYKGKGSFTNAKPGDILIVRSNGKDFTHVELVSKIPSSKSITAIGGNTGNSNHSKAKVQEHSWNKSSISYIIRPAYKANTLSYLERCQKTDTAVTLKATDSKNYIMTLPCSSGTDSGSKAFRKMIKNETFKATAIYKNTAGNYWYKVTADRDGKTGYVYAGAASYTGISKEAVRGNLTLATTAPKKGKAVTISGTISGNGAKIVSVKGILKGTGSTQTASANVNGSSFSLKGSKVDGGLKFGKLGVGAGSIRLEVVVQVSYIGTNNKKVTANGTIILPEVKFTVKK